MYWHPQILTVVIIPFFRQRHTVFRKGTEMIKKTGENGQVSVATVET
jgi:hypothetical protein